MRELEHCMAEYCLFCGELLKSGFEDCQYFTYCDCEDVKKIEDIDFKIKELENSKPEAKYKFVEKVFIEEVNK